MVHYVEFRHGGAVHYPFGQDAVGCISYSVSGVMAVQMSRRQRANTPEGGLLDYLAYFGRFEVDTEKQLVRHLLEGQVTPGRHPEMLERKFRFYEDKLALGPVRRRRVGDCLAAYVNLSTRLRWVESVIPFTRDALDLSRMLCTCQLITISPLWGMAKVRGVG